MFCGCNHALVHLTFSWASTTNIRCNVLRCTKYAVLLLKTLQFQTEEHEKKRIRRRGQEGGYIVEEKDNREKEEQHGEDRGGGKARRKRH